MALRDDPPIIVVYLKWPSRKRKFSSIKKSSQIRTAPLIKVVKFECSSFCRSSFFPKMGRSRNQSPGLRDWNPKASAVGEKGIGFGREAILHQI